MLDWATSLDQTPQLLDRLFFASVAQSTYGVRLNGFSVNCYSTVIPEPVNPILLIHRETKLHSENFSLIWWQILIRFPKRKMKYIIYIIIYNIIL